jgi:DNA polymerase III gamma/tau subunit
LKNNDIDDEVTSGGLRMPATKTKKSTKAKKTSKPTKAKKTTKVAKVKKGVKATKAKAKKATKSAKKKVVKAKKAAKKAKAKKTTKVAKVKKGVKATKAKKTTKTAKVAKATKATKAKKSAPKVETTAPTEPAKEVSSHSLSTEERNELPESNFAFPEERKEPLDDATHVRNAIARFDQVTDVSDEERDRAWERIKAAAKEFDVHISEDDWRDLFKEATKGD